MHKRIIPLATFTALALVLFWSPDAFAAGNIIDRGDSLISFLSERVGPIVIGLGLVAGAAALALGIPGAVQKLMAVVVGGILLTSVGSVLSIIGSF